MAPFRHSQRGFLARTRRERVNFVGLFCSSMAKRHGRLSRLSSVVLFCLPPRLVSRERKRTKPLSCSLCLCTNERKQRRAKEHMHGNLACLLLASVEWPAMSLSSAGFCAISQQVLSALCDCECTRCLPSQVHALNQSLAKRFASVAAFLPADCLSWEFLVARP